jgi:hypothetical protein
MSEKKQASWIDKRKKQNEWKDVRVIDGTKIIDWLHHFPSIETWLGQKMGLPAQHIMNLELHWSDLKSIGDPPPLIPQVFLDNRDLACNKLESFFDGKILELKLETRYPSQAADFVSAYVANLPDDIRLEILGRAFIVSSEEAWNSIVSLNEPHILISDFDLDLTGRGAALLSKANKARHKVIYYSQPGGIPHPNSVPILNPKAFQLKDSLVKAGYGEERARSLAHKTDGNLSSFLRCIQGLSLMNEWAEKSTAADLVIAQLLGSWSEKVDGDRQVVEGLSGNAYGEWIGKIRDELNASNTPLNHKEGIWKFVARYEGWFSLGARIFDEHLERFRSIAIEVLKQKDPKFEMPSDQHYLAAFQGKVLPHSNALRRGLAESLALMGSQPKALICCSLGKSETTAYTVVKEILNDGDWVTWASLNDLLPLLAEAAPSVFLDAVENILDNPSKPFTNIFAQETNAVSGRNYMSGLLWALESLAWEENFLTRAVVLLGDLASLDPGGNWSNRPINSLTTILLPWLPQTCANIDKRRVAIATLLKEHPRVGWNLLLKLLPKRSSISMGSHKPLFRSSIPEDWNSKVTIDDYHKQIYLFAELIVGEAKSNFDNLVQVVDRIDDLPSEVHEHLLNFLRSEDFLFSITSTQRMNLWSKLTSLVVKHRKYEESDWSMDRGKLENIEKIADLIKPTEPFLYNQRLFSERELDLFESKGDYAQQQERLDGLRQTAASEILSHGGFSKILEFSEAVDSPWRVGYAFAAISNQDYDELILPEFLNSPSESSKRFTGGYIIGKFKESSWNWVDSINMSKWELEDVSLFFTFMPFKNETWSRVYAILGKNESIYWKETSANSYDAQDDIYTAIDKLVQYGRPQAALGCFGHFIHNNLPFESSKAISVLGLAVNSEENILSNEEYLIQEIIKALQNSPEVEEDDMFKIEWSYLQLLDRDQGLQPKFLEKKLSSDPAFFSSVIRLVFLSHEDIEKSIEVDESRKNLASHAYTLLQEWSQIPGVKSDGEFDEKAFTLWLEEVKRECSSTGHLEIAMTIVGKALTHAPSDIDGLWINKTIAASLNARDARDMRDGYRTELYNARGFHWVDPTGEPERELAENYRQKANNVEDAGFQRLAATLRGLAESYDMEADRVNMGHDDF